MGISTIWSVPDPVAAATADAAGCMNEHVGLEFLEFGSDWLSARLPVDHRTRQPAGLLHGGAAVVLAETLASAACYYTLDHARQHCVGLEINANHLRAVRAGWVTGRAAPLHLGRTTQVWDVRLHDDAGRPTCVSRCTMAILTRGEK